MHFNLIIHLYDFKMGGCFLLDKRKILKFLGYKLVRFAILLIVVILLSFILIDMSPINPVNAYISNMVVSPEKIAQLEAYWGVNQPITEKMINWLGNILTGDFGTSLIYRSPVLQVISEKFTASFNSFTNNSAPNTGALYADSRTTFSSFANNTFISNKATDASGNAGAVRFSGEAAIADSRFIDNSCNGAGGAIFANGKLNISGSTFENNTAGTNGGAISSNNGNGNLFVNESSFKYNKAPTGSAIRARSVNIENTELLENQALFDKWNNQRHSFTENHVSINGTFVGMDNYLNAINAGSGTFSNVVYCGVNGGGVDEGTTNTDDVTSAKSFNEVHQIVILEIFDENNNLVESIKQYTDASGNYNFEVDLSSDAQSYSYRISHPEDNYYTYAEYTLHKDSSVLNISCQNITYPEDENITFEVSGIDGMTPTGNITVVINDTNGVIIYNDTIQLSSGKAKLDFSKLNASEYYIHARYNGDENYLPDNETAVFHVNQTKPSMDLETITPVSYGDNETLVVTVIPVVGGIVPTGNVTVVITDSEGNVVVTFNEKALTDGSVEINVTGLAVGEYNVNATYS